MELPALSGAVVCHMHITAHPARSNSFLRKPLLPDEPKLDRYQKFKWFGSLKTDFLEQNQTHHSGTEIFQKDNCVLLSAVSLCPKCAVLVLLVTSKVPRV